MGKAYPKDMKAKFKARVMALVQKDHTFKEIAEELGIASTLRFSSHAKRGNISPIWLRRSDTCGMKRR